MSAFGTQCKRSLVCNEEEKSTRLSGGPVTSATKHQIPEPIYRQKSSSQLDRHCDTGRSRFLFAVRMWARASNGKELTYLSERQGRQMCQSSLYDLKIQFFKISCAFLHLCELIQRNPKYKCLTKKMCLFCVIKIPRRQYISCILITHRDCLSAMDTASKKREKSRGDVCFCQRSSFLCMDV